MRLFSSRISGDFFMNYLSVLTVRFCLFFSMFIGAFFSPLMSVQAEEFKPALQLRVERYQKNLVEWAASPLVIAAVNESNKQGYISGMSNAQWGALPESDPYVIRLHQNALGEQIAKWEEDKAFEKLNVRNIKGYLAAYSSNNAKPLLFNNSGRPAFVNGLKGIWSAKEVKPDPTTHNNAVQISAPILDKGRVIGVIHAAVLAE
jgi:hypothetical protein